MPGKLKINIKGKNTYEIDGTSLEGIQPSEYVELAAAFIILATERSGVDIRNVLDLTERRTRYAYDKNELDEKVQKGLKKTPKV